MPVTPDDANKHLQRIHLTDEERQLLLVAAEQADPLSESQPIPLVIQRALRRNFSARQLATVSIMAEELKRVGFGELIIHFMKHRPRRINKSESEDFE
jgi:hypothetical protein